MPSLRFFVTCVLAATAAELTKLQTISRGFLVLCRNVVATLAFAALQHNVISRHKLFPISDCQFPIFMCDQSPLSFQSAIGNWKSAMMLFDHFRNRARAHRSAPFADGEP